MPRAISKRLPKIIKKLKASAVRHFPSKDHNKTASNSNTTTSLSQGKLG